MIPKHWLRISVCLILLMSFFTGCEFQLHDLPVNDIDKPADIGPPVQMSLNDKHDTISIGWQTEFHYDITGTENKINYVTVSFEGTVIHNYVADNQQTFTFTFDPADYSDGNYHLNIMIYTSTGSGSIADKTGAEAYLYELEWPVYIDKTMPEYSHSYLTATRSQEGINLTWNSFNHPNFVSYTVYRYYTFAQANPVVIATITDPLLNSFTDTTFCEGQNIRYFVRTVTPAGYSEGQDIVFFDELHGLKATWNTDGTADVTWDKAKNLESFSKYYIYSGYRSTDPIEEHFIEDPEQNYVKLEKAGFGSGLYIYLKFIPDGISPDSYRYLNSTSITLDPPRMIPSFFYGCNVNNRNFLLLSGMDKIYRYFPEDRKTEDSISVNLEKYWLIAVSSEGNEFVYYQDEKFYIRRTEDFSLLNEFPGPPLQSNNRTMERCSLSDNGSLLAVDNEGYAYLYNTRNGTLIREDSMNIGGYPMKIACISPDGTKIALTTNSNSTVLYSLNSEGWTEIGRTDILLYNLFFSKDGTTVYVAGYEKLEKRSADSFSLISDYSLQGGYFQSVDLDRERIFYVTSKEFEHKIADLNTGQVLRTIILGNSWCRLFENYLVASGLQLTLPEFE